MNFSGYEAETFPLFCHYPWVFEVAACVGNPSLSACKYKQEENNFFIHAIWSEHQQVSKVGEDQSQQFMSVTSVLVFFLVSGHSRKGHRNSATTSFAQTATCSFNLKGMKLCRDQRGSFIPALRKVHWNLSQASSTLTQQNQSYALLPRLGMEQVSEPTEHPHFTCE